MRHVSLCSFSDVYFRRRKLVLIFTISHLRAGIYLLFYYYLHYKKTCSWRILYARGVALNFSISSIKMLKLRGSRIDYFLLFGSFNLVHLLIIREMFLSTFGGVSSRSRSIKLWQLTTCRWTAGDNLWRWRIAYLFDNLGVYHITHLRRERNMRGWRDYGLKSSIIVKNYETNLHDDEKQKERRKEGKFHGNLILFVSGGNQ